MRSRSALPMAIWRTHMKATRMLRFLIPLLGVGIALPAGAVSWNTTGSIGLTSGSIYCSTTTCSTSSSGLSGSVIKMSAFATPAAPTSGTPVDTGNWVTSRIAMYGGGVGAANYNETDVSPQHAIDNWYTNDLLVVDFGSDNWDVSSFSIGWSCTVSGSTSCSGSTVNPSAWVGGTGAINFTTIGFSGNGSSATLPGFQALTLTPDAGGTGVRTDTTNPSPLGRYLIIAGDLADYTSAFKVSGISAAQVTPPPPGAVPIPGTLALLVLGLLALTLASRRRPAPVRR